MSVCTEIAMAIAPQPALGELLDEHDFGRQVAAAPAPLHGVVEAEEAELAGPAEDVVREVAGLLPVVDVRRELGRDEPADGRPELVVLGGEDRVPGQRRVHGDHGATDRQREGFEP